MNMPRKVDGSIESKMKTYHDTYASEDRELFERALICPLHTDHEIDKMMKALTEWMDRLKALTSAEIITLFSSGQIKL
jgi:hypothetical protein